MGKGRDMISGENTPIMQLSTWRLPLASVCIDNLLK